MVVRPNNLEGVVGLCDSLWHLLYRLYHPSKDTGLTIIRLTNINFLSVFALYFGMPIFIDAALGYVGWLLVFNVFFMKGINQTHIPNKIFATRNVGADGFVDDGRKG